ncbi:hypothetical protein TNCV_2502921 [Trichonephila clavipes]|nr:hypothetical protein TNCV_2502921 [Trichonephila clavipes]
MLQETAPFEQAYSTLLWEVARLSDRREPATFGFDDTATSESVDRRTNDIVVTMSVSSCYLEELCQASFFFGCYFSGRWCPECSEGYAFLSSARATNEVARLSYKTEPATFGSISMLDKSGVFDSAEWHDGDWSSDGIREACLWFFIWVNPGGVAMVLHLGGKLFGLAESLEAAL